MRQFVPHSLRCVLSLALLLATCSSDPGSPASAGSETTNGAVVIADAGGIRGTTECGTVVAAFSNDYDPLVGTGQYRDTLQLGGDGGFSAGSLAFGT